MLKMCSTGIKAHTKTSNHGLRHNFKSSEAIVKGFTSVRNALVKCLRFQLELITLGALGFLTSKNLKDCSRSNMGAVPQKLRIVGHMLLYTFYSVSLWVIHS